MRYSIYTGIEQQKLNVKKLVIAGVAALGMFTAAAVPALAAPGDNASDCGAAHGAFASVNGNFGFLGDVGGTPGYHGGAKGQDPGATGYNNSHTDCQG